MPPFVQRPPAALVMTPHLCLSPRLVVTVIVTVTATAFLAASTGLAARSTPPAGRASDHGPPRR